MLTKRSKVKGAARAKTKKSIVTHNQKDVKLVEVDELNEDFEDEVIQPQNGQSSCGNCGVKLGDLDHKVNSIFSDWNKPIKNKETRKSSRKSNKMLSKVDTDKKPLSKAVIQQCQMTIFQTLGRVFQSNPFDNNCVQKQEEDEKSSILCLQCGDTLSVLYNALKKFVSFTTQDSGVMNWFSERGEKHVGNLAEIIMKEEDAESVMSPMPNMPNIDLTGYGQQMDLFENYTLNDLNEQWTTETDETMEEAIVIDEGPLDLPDSMDFAQDEECPLESYVEEGPSQDEDYKMEDLSGDSDDNYEPPVKSNPKSGKAGKKTRTYFADRTKDRRFICSVCNQTFGHRKSHTRHFMRHFDGIDQTAKCPTCDKLFSREEGLRNHRRMVHGEDIPVPPSATKKYDKTKKDGKNSFKRKSAQTRKCPVCNTFWTRYDIQAHVDSHSEATPWKCDICPTSFATDSELHKHKQSQHAIKRWEKCDICNKYIKDLKSHKIKIHQKQHICEHCSKAFGKKERLLYHVKVVHEKTFLLTCPVLTCGRKFNKLQDMQLHDLRVHQKDTKFKKHTCQICEGVEFCQIKDFKKHMYRVHRQRDFMCEHCGLEFTRVDNMQAHLTRKHGIISTV